MIRLYRSSEFFSKAETIVDAESFFRVRIPPTFLTQESLEAMQIIDNAELLDRNTGAIRTPFGVCSMDDLSTGCKTVISALYIHANRDKYCNIKALDATDSGVNAIDLLFEYIEKLGIDLSIIVEHQDIFDCKDRTYLIDGEFKVNSLLTMEEIE